MTHRMVRRLVSAQVDGEADGLEVKLVQEHLSRCAECKAYEAGIRALRSDFRSIESIVYRPGFVSDVLRRTRMEAEEFRMWSPAELVAKRFVAALAAAVLIFVSVAMIVQPEEAVVIDRYLAGEQSDSTAAALLARDVISNEDLLLAAVSRK